MGNNCECNCPTNKNGTQCEFSRDITCNEHGNPHMDGTCTCDESWIDDESGNKCSKHINLCLIDPPPCKNNSSCDDDPDGSYTCDCDIGWSGRNCDKDINECKNNPCKNGSTCKNLQGGYECDCSNTGFKGKN